MGSMGSLPYSGSFLGFLSPKTLKPSGFISSTIWLQEPGFGVKPKDQA